MRPLRSASMILEIVMVFALREGVSNILSRGIKSVHTSSVEIPMDCRKLAILRTGGEPKLLQLHLQRRPGGFCWLMASSNSCRDPHGRGWWACAFQPVLQADHVAVLRIHLTKDVPRRPRHALTNLRVRILERCARPCPAAASSALVPPACGSA